MKYYHARIFSTVVTVLILSILSSCQFSSVRGNGHRITENRKLENFSKIDLSGGFDIKLKQDSSLSVSITADDNLMKHIRTQVSGGKLRIYSKRGMHSEGPLTVVIGFRHINEIKAMGAIDISGETPITADDFKIKFSGAGKIKLNLNAANVVTDASGATEMHLTGQAASHKVELSGAGKLFANDFVVSDYNIETSGATHCEINVLKSLKVHSSGASEVTYRGNPSNVSQHKSGAASLTKVN